MVGSFPVATVGGYYNTAIGSSYIHVTNAATAGFAAYQGSQFLDIYRNGGGCSTRLSGNATGNSLMGDNIEAKFAFRSTGLSYNQINLLYDDENENGTSMFIRSDNTVRDARRHH